MHSKKHRKNNRTFIRDSHREIMEILCEALMNGGKAKQRSLLPASSVEDYQQRLASKRMLKKMRAAGLLDDDGRITPKGEELVKS